jgi:hypothetical protein
MKLSALLQPLIDAKVPHDLIMAQIVAFEAQQDQAIERRRQSDAARQAKKRDADKSRDITLRHSDTPLTGGDARGLDNSLTQKIEPQESKKEKEGKSAQARIASSFEEFWIAYPNKVGKADAARAFAKAVGRAELGAIMAGLARYRSKADDRPWCNPATWLNQDRWTDEPAVAVPQARASPPKRTLADAFAAFGTELENRNELRSSGSDDRSEKVVSYLPAVRSG